MLQSGRYGVASNFFSGSQIALDAVRESCRLSWLEQTGHEETPDVKARGFLVLGQEKPMADKPRDDLLVNMFEIEVSGDIEEVMSRALAAMTSLGWTPKDSTNTWRQAVGAGSIRYNAWRQP